MESRQVDKGSRTNPTIFQVLHRSNATRPTNPSMSAKLNNASAVSAEDEDDDETAAHGGQQLINFERRNFFHTTVPPARRGDKCGFPIDAKG
jgi:hypothetical protein